MHRQRGTKYQAIATYGSAPEHREFALNRIPFEAGRGTVLGRTVLERKPVQVLDVVADPDYSLQEVQKKFGFRTVLGCSDATRRQSSRRDRAAAAYREALHREANRTGANFCGSGGHRHRKRAIV